MKILRKILVIHLIIFAVIFCSGYIFVAFFAKPVIEAQIEKQLGIEAEISSVSLTLPLAIEINNFILKDIAAIKKIRISPSIIGFLAGKIVLNNVSVIKPELTIERKKDGTFNIPQIKQTGKSQVIAAGISIKDGRILVRDKKVSEEVFSFEVKNLNAYIRKASLLPYPLKIEYDISADILSRPGIENAVIAGKGWIDWTNKDMLGDLNISGIDAMLFAPYFRNFVAKPEQLGQAKASFGADLSAENNDLLVKCRLLINNLSAKKETGEQAAEKSIAESLQTAALELLKTPADEIVIDFEIRTKLDRPRMDKMALKGAVFQPIIQKAIEKPEELKDTIEGLGEQIKEKIKNIDKEDMQELKEKGKEIEDAFKAIFKKKSQ